MVELKKVRLLNSSKLVPHGFQRCLRIFQMTVLEINMLRHRNQVLDKLKKSKELLLKRKPILEKN